MQRSTPAAISRVRVCTVLQQQPHDVALIPREMGAIDRNVRAHRAVQQSRAVTPAVILRVHVVFKVPIIVVEEILVDLSSAIEICVEPIF